ncbi:copper-binding protein [Pseudomonas sp. Au-Pse12]|uniref:copper-binding protein n=1 Tax=Pseudomonas sp. Au-Pse12 TaxID=2906459 RepID=UPI001E293646|nr:copper-binding protein [Pseudomonas sp. Au-Pse12]MCE4054722.1 copper-binding protein [Pseudomonas sp. Au-Pse12]
MKLTLIAVAGTVAALSLSAQAEDMPGMKMDATSMKGMQIQQETQQAPVAKAEGTIKAIDTTKHTVTVAHGAVPAVQWPAMTMAFNATAKQLEGLKAGDKVAFEFRADGMAATIVSIKSLKQ